MAAKKYKIILADPPWEFKNYNDQTASRWVGDFYPMLGVDDICQLPVGKIAADDCCLFLWGTWPKLIDVLSVVDAWGFTYKTSGFVWVKENRVSDGFFTGMGYWTRANTEYCLLATRGHPTRVDASVRELIIAPRQKHSAKPPEVRDRIVQLLGDLPRIGLFARERVDGWDAMGYDISGKSIEQELDELILKEGDK